MNMQDLVAKIAAAHPEAPPQKIRAVLQTALGLFKDMLQTAPEGHISTPLGTFFIIVRQNPESQDPNDTIRRIWLSLPKEPGAAAPTVLPLD